MLSCQMEGSELVPLLIAAGGGGNAYLENPESSLDQVPLEQYENSTMAPSTNGQTGAAGTIIEVTVLPMQTTKKIFCQLPVVVSRCAYSLFYVPKSYL